MRVMTSLEELSFISWQQQIFFLFLYGKVHQTAFPQIYKNPVVKGRKSKNDSLVVFEFLNITAMKKSVTELSIEIIWNSKSEKQTNNKKKHR